MKKVLYIATTADNRNRLDGETIKCRLLRDYLSEIDGIKLKTIDTDNWKKHIFKLIFLIIIYTIWCDEIVLSSADNGAHIVLDFYDKIKLKKKIYYFVIGGSLSRNIEEKKWNANSYTKIKKIYVEADILKKNLGKLGITNVSVLNNFRKFNKFENKYKKTNYIKFVYYGRVIKKKGIEEAIKLINRLNKENIECTLDIYGQCKEDYLAKIEKYFNNKIIYHGEIKPNNKIEYEILSQYDIFIFPTEYPGECLPGALIDCYIAGLAVIASNWKYAREYILDNENGKIFKYKDYNDMYEKTIKMINENSIMKYKEKSKDLSKKYDMNNILLNFKEDLLEDINENS